MVDPRSQERHIAALMKRIDRGGITTPEQVTEFLSTLKSREDLPEYEPETPLEEAQALIYDAWETTSERRKVQLAKKALEICPDCADAYVLLAEETATSARQARDLYQSGVEAGERALGPDIFEEESGEYWDTIEARPYLRALKGLAECEWQIGHRDQAIDLLRRLLDLNPNDNQGARYLLLASLLELGQTNAVRVLLRKYKDDPAASWAYGRALVTFLERGNCSQSRAQLQEAIRKNVFFPAYLLGIEPLPATLPEYIEFGEDSEGVSCFIEQGSTWLRHEEAMAWMVEVILGTGPPS